MGYDFFDSFMNIVIGFLFLIGIAIFISVPVLLYRGNACATHCSHTQQVCVTAPIGGDFVCAPPGTRNVNLNVESK